MQSIIQEVGAVKFAAHTGERVHMLGFHKEEGLPAHLSRWQETVDQMLTGIDTDLPIYLMIDQGHVKAGNPHRRPGLHIDGFWVPGTLLQAGRHLGESTTPGFKSDWQMEQEEQERRRNDRIKKINKRLPKRSQIDDLEAAGYVTTGYDEAGWPIEAIVLASNVAACRALVGEYDGKIGSGGDVTHLDLSHMREVMFEANRAYAGNVTFVHESLPVQFDCERTVVRLNVPGYVIH